MLVIDRPEGPIHIPQPVSWQGALRGTAKSRRKWMVVVLPNQTSTLQRLVKYHQPSREMLLRFDPTRRALFVHLLPCLPIFSMHAWIYPPGPEICFPSFPGAANITSVVIGASRACLVPGIIKTCCFMLHFSSCMNRGSTTYIESS
jgi:hypothetical protein